LPDISTTRINGLAWKNTSFKTWIWSKQNFRLQFCYRLLDICSKDHKNQWTSVKEQSLHVIHHFLKSWWSNSCLETRKQQNDMKRLHVHKQDAWSYLRSVLSDLERKGPTRAIN
jgi:hypothetical protein